MIMSIIHMVRGGTRDGMIGGEVPELYLSALAGGAMAFRSDDT
jgi:hypothetical protein